MKLRLATTALLFSLLASNLAAEASLAQQPKDFVAVYKAKYHGISVTATRSLRSLSDGLQIFSFEADSWLADLTETTVFRWSETDHIIPIQYVYERNGLGRDREATVHFDWENLSVTNNVERKPWKMKIPVETLDKLSYQLQIRTDMINNKPLLRYQIADGGRLKEYGFEVLGEEEVKTPAGRFRAVKVKRVREDEERSTFFWMAKDWDYMIVRLQQQEDDGENYEIDLFKATLDGKEVTGL